MGGGVKGWMDGLVGELVRGWMGEWESERIWMDGWVSRGVGGWMGG